MPSSMIQGAPTGAQWAAFGSVTQPTRSSILTADKTRVDKRNSAEGGKESSVPPRRPHKELDVMLSEEGRPVETNNIPNLTPVLTM